MAEPTIQFDDDIHPVQAQSGGVYRLRSREVAGIGSIRTPSHGRRVKAEEAEAESTNNVEDRDFKPKQV